ncbi:MAG TPA: SPOR domain-containing protein [Vicinamibacterales bacterium]|nr:SPOR domain-containing protein [Vicinamibacterales bacterium]
MSDEQFREIQLNGKQLVFLFMAATVVSVVIFLCGVLVGRGVRAQAEPAATEAAATMGATGGLAAPAGDPADHVATPDVPVTAPIPKASTNDQLTYYRRLDSRNPPPDTLKPARPAPAAVPPAPAARAQTRVATADRAAARVPAAAVARQARDAREAEATLAPPAGPGYAVQVAALRDRREADAVARRLVDKGYRAYVVEPAGGRPAVFRVRVGKFRTRREAQVMAIRLEKEEQFKPWITR